ncbi:TPA: hypothetical protein L1421_003783 [Escherichia coli]|nr:hypothetical protein [Escherichia coli]
MNKIHCGLTGLLFEDGKEFINNNDHLSYLEKKLSATKLAASIYCNNKRLGIVQPNIIQEWEKMCNSKNEFDEIKNEWDNHI